MGDRPREKGRHKRECEKQEGLRDKAREGNTMRKTKKKKKKSTRQGGRAHGFTKLIHLQPSYMPLHSCTLWIWPMDLFHHWFNPTIVRKPSINIWWSRWDRFLIGLIQRTLWHKAAAIVSANSGQRIKISTMLTLVACGLVTKANIRGSWRNLFHWAYCKQ